MAVTKTHSAETVMEAYAAGLRLFGENRVQEWQEKSLALAHLPGAEFHLVGRCSPTRPPAPWNSSMPSTRSTR